MALIAFTIALLLAVCVLALVTARLFKDYPVSELLDWKPTRSPEVEVQNEMDDVQQMIDAQNELRRKRGAAEITEADVHRQAREDQAVRARGRGPFAAGGDPGDEAPPSGTRPEKPARKRRRKPPAKKR